MNILLEKYKSSANFQSEGFWDTHDALEQIQLLDTESQDRRKLLLGKPDKQQAALLPTKGQPVVVFHTLPCGR